MGGCVSKGAISGVDTAQILTLQLSNMIRTFSKIKIFIKMGNKNIFVYLEINGMDIFKEKLFYKKKLCIIQTAILLELCAVVWVVAGKKGSVLQVMGI
jgi:hypothetical protein